MNSIVKKKNKQSKRKGRQLDPSALAEVQKLLEDLPRRKELLIEALHLIQDRYHYLSAKHLVALAHELKLSSAEVYEVATFYHHFDVIKESDLNGPDKALPPPITVRVCDSVTCEMFGAKELSDAPRFGAERRYIDRLGRFVTCDEDEADKNGYKHAGLNNDQMIQNARKLIHANRNPNYQKIIDGAETLITNGVLRYGKVRKVNLGDQ